MTEQDMKETINRVIIVTDNAYVNGGSGKVALSSALALQRRGIPTSIFAAVGPVAAELADEPGLEVLCTNQPDILSDPDRLGAARRGIWNSAARRAMKQRLALADPKRTVIHVHSWTKALSASVLSAAVESGFPVIATLHDYFAACPIGSFYDHQLGKICTVKPMGASCLTRNCDSRSGAHKAWRVGRQALQQTLGMVPNGIRDFITISQLSEAVMRPYLAKDAILHFVQNPIDVERAEPVQPAKSREFTYVGRLSQEKGAVLFARAAQRLGVQAVFVGEGECADEIRAANPSAVITGWLDHAGAMDRMRTARVIVLPSLWYENAPLVIPEAAAMGLPGLVPDTSAARESIINGVTGLTFAGTSEDDLVAKLAVLRDDDIVARFGAAAYNTYWQQPQSMERHVDGLIEVYGRALKGVATPFRQSRMQSVPVEVPA